MSWQHTPVAVLLFVATGVSIALVVVALSRVGEKPAPAGTGPFVAVAASAAAWSGAYALQVTATTMATKLFWHRATWVGVGVLTVAWPVFVVVYTDHEEWLSWPRMGLASVVPAVTVLFVWLPPYSWLVLGEPSMVTVSGFSTLVTTGGPMFSVFSAYSYGLNLVAMGLLVREVASTRGLHRKQALLLLVASVVPTVLSVLRHAGAFPEWWPDPTPVSFAVTTTLVAWGLFRYRLLDLVPVARDVVLEEMRDGVVVLDGSRRVVDVNPAARRLLGGDGRLVGRPAADVFERWPRLAEALDAGDAGPFEVAVDDGLESRTFEATVSGISGGEYRGCAVVLRDVTARARHQQRLQVLNRVLRHDLRNEVNVIRGHAELLLERVSDPEVRAQAESVLDASRDLVELGRKASLVEAPEADDRSLEVVNLAVIARAQVERARREFPDATVAVDAPESARAYADPLVDAAVENLIENAVEHHDAESPRVTVSVEVAAGEASVSVADDGPGIPAREREVLREGVETPLEHGSGLGLWLVNWIVSNSSGELDIDADGDGTVVTLRFRRAE